MTRLTGAARRGWCVGLVGVVAAVSLAGCGPARASDPAPGTAQAVSLPAQAQGSISAMSFPTRMNGWMAVSSSVPGSSQATQSILTTSNGGLTWRQTWKGGEIPFFSTSQGSDYGWVLGGGSSACGQPTSTRAECPSSYLLATADSGATWQQLPAAPMRLSQLAFASPQLGIAASSPTCAAESSLSTAPCPGEVLLTTDGGSHWRIVLRTKGLVAAIAAKGNALWAVTGLPGLASKQPGTPSPRLLVMRSLDRGLHWSQVASLGPLFAIGPALEARLQIGVGGEMWLSYLEQDSCAMHGCGALGGFESLDGGVVWRPVGVPDPTPQAECGDFSPPGSVAITPSGTVIGTYQRSLATCGGPAASLSEDVQGGWRPIHSWNFFSPRELTFPSNSVGYAENGAALLATSDGGTSWTQLWPATTPTDGLDAVSGSTAFAYGTQSSDSSVLVTTDSGRLWKVVARLPRQVLALDMANSKDGFVAVTGIGSQSQSFDLYRTQDGGRRWRLVGPGFPLQGWEVLGLWLTPSGNGVGAINGTETGAGLPGPTEFFASSDQGRIWQPEGTVAHGFDLVAGATFQKLQNGTWLGFAEVNRGRGTELEESRNLGRTWSSVTGAPSRLVALHLEGGGGGLVGATVGPGGNSLLTIYRAAQATGPWRPEARRSTLAQDGSVSTEDISFAGPMVAWILVAGSVWETVNGGSSWRAA